MSNNTEYVVTVDQPIQSDWGSFQSFRARAQEHTDDWVEFMGVNIKNVSALTVNKDNIVAIAHEGFDDK